MASAFHIFLVGLSEDLTIFECTQQHLDLDSKKTAHLSPAKSNKLVFSEIHPGDSYPTQNIGDGLKMPS